MACPPKQRPPETPMLERSFGSAEQVAESLLVSCGVPKVAVAKTLIPEAKLQTCFALDV